MCYDKKLNFAFLIFLTTLFSSCSKDSDLLDSSEVSNSEIALGRGVQDGGPNGGPGGGPPPGQENLQADLVRDWTDLFLQLDQQATGMRPNATARAIAYINLASYETAVPFLPRLRSNDSRLIDLEIERNQLPNNVDVEIALNRCFALVLDHFLLNLPNTDRSLIPLFEKNRESTISEGESESKIVNSREWGAYVANQVIAYSQTDLPAESQILDPQPRSYEPPAGDGFWTYSADPERALFPYWKDVRTFVISPSQTTTRPPKPYSVAEQSPYHVEMLEVVAINNQAKTEDGEDLWIAEFWSDDVEKLMVSPPGRQVSIANQLIEQFDLDLGEALELLVRLGFALNDAAVSTWADKYDYMVMRPNVYIQEHIDPSFQTNLYRLIYWPNPSFPGYPSGHSCFASAAAGLFRSQFGDQVNFTDRTHEDATAFRGAARSFNSFSAMAEENAFSRVPLGVHMRMDCVEGLRLGYEISRAVDRLDLQRRERPLAANE